MAMRGLLTGLGGALILSAIIAGLSAVHAGGDVTYEKDIQPLMAKRCIVCHGSKSPTLEEFDKDKEQYKKEKKGPRMDTYVNLVVFVNGSDAGAVMRRLDDGKSTSDGKPGNMYLLLGPNEAERQRNLAMFKQWVGSWNLKKRAQLTAEEIEAIKAPEK